jgi:hypothetical protein
LRMILDGAMTIYNASEIKTQLLKALGSCDILEIDLCQRDGYRRFSAAGDG